LSWESWKYLDGLRDLVRWTRGRCLAYGEGVTYWALAEMVRSRADILEGEDPASARAKLRAAALEFVPEPEERGWIEARLAHLLALEERQARDPEDLFGAWRRFFERIAERDPVVMIFEDLQWADPSLLDFIEYLLNWSRGFPIFVMSLARPEISDRFPTWAAARRGVSTRRAGRRVEPVFAGAQGGTGRPGGPPLTRTRAVRVPPGPGAAGGVRDALEARPQGPPPGHGRILRTAVGRRGARDRRG